MPGSLFCFGLGYSALALAQELRQLGWRVAGTARRPERLAQLARLGITAHAFDDGQPLPAAALAGVTHILQSIPPIPAGDPVLPVLATVPAELRWVGYLSTTGVYGDHGGAWVDETTPPAPGSDRSRRRAAAEQAWLTWGAERRILTQIFRLAGIYGPGRSVFDDIRAGTAQRVVRPGQLFSRIHVSDIAGVLTAAMSGGSQDRLFNVCDDEPAASAEVVRFACALLGVPPPPEIPFAEARLSAMALSFWADNKRVDNRRIKTSLGVRLAYPSYRDGLSAILAAESGHGS